MTTPRFNPMFNSKQIEVLPCPKCSKPMQMTLIEPIKAGLELRSYRCTTCNVHESFHIKS